MGCMSCLNCLCCIYLLVFNIVGMLLGFIFLLLGILLIWGFQIMNMAMSSTIQPMLSSLESSLKEATGTDINIAELLNNLSEISGTMGAAFLALGLIILLISCFGCCGGCCGNKICLIIYLVAVCAIFLTQLVMVIIWFANAELLKSHAKTAMTDSVKQFTGINSKNIQSLIQNIVQIFIGCCGVDNGTDFLTMSPNWNRTYQVNSSGYSYVFNLTYPVTCCKFDTSTFEPVDTYCPYNNTTPETSNYQKGCYNEMFTYVETYIKIDYIFYGLCGFLGCQLLLALGAIVRLRHTANSKKVKPV